MPVLQSVANNRLHRDDGWALGSQPALKEPDAAPLNPQLFTSVVSPHGLFTLIRAAKENRSRTEGRHNET